MRTSENIGLSRRSFVAAVFGGVSIISASGYGWRRYSRRNYLDLRLFGYNRANEPVDVSVTVLEEGDVFYEQTAELGAAGDDRQTDEQHLPGPWIKRPGAYSLQISAGNESMELTNEEIIDRLDQPGWRSERVNVEIVITEDRALETNVTSPDSE